MIANLDLVDESADIVSGQTRKLATTAHLEALLAYCESLRVSLNERDMVIAHLIRNGEEREFGPRRVTTAATLTHDLAESLRLRLVERMDS
jgi:hypothetical protein